MTTSALGPLLAHGRTAEVYEWEATQIVKLFHDWCPQRWIQSEIDNGRTVMTMDLSTRA
jgi:hypothetical protein